MKHPVKPGRPAKEPTTVISVPVNRIKAVERALGREIAVNQVAIVKVRIPTADVAAIRRVIEGKK